MTAPVVFTEKEENQFYEVIARRFLSAGIFLFRFRREIAFRAILCLYGYKEVSSDASSFF